MQVADDAVNQETNEASNKTNVQNVFLPESAHFYIINACR